VRLDIDALAQLALGDTMAAEVDVQSAAASPRSQRRRQLEVFGLQTVQRSVPAVARVDVQHGVPGQRPGADVAARERAPPAVDQIKVGGGAVQPVAQPVAASRHVSAVDG
jgi:hypothetical protein